MTSTPSAVNQGSSAPSSDGTETSNTNDKGNADDGNANSNTRDPSLNGAGDGNDQNGKMIGGTVGGIVAAIVIVVVVVWLIGKVSLSHRLFRSLRCIQFSECGSNS